jgi:hypothetical protein
LKDLTCVRIHWLIVIYRQGKLCLGFSVKDIRVSDATKYFWEISNLNVCFLNSVFSNLIKVRIARIFYSITFKIKFNMAGLAYITLIFTLCANISQQKIKKWPLAKQRTLQHPSQIECAKGKHLETINEGIAGEESYCALILSPTVSAPNANPYTNSQKTLRRPQEHFVVRDWSTGSQ